MLFGNELESCPIEFNIELAGFDPPRCPPIEFFNEGILVAEELRNEGAN